MNHDGSWFDRKSSERSTQGKSRRLEKFTGGRGDEVGDKRVKVLHVRERIYVVLKFFHEACVKIMIKLLI